MTECPKKGESMNVEEDEVALLQESHVGNTAAGFGSLMVDDREKVTQKILDAFKESGQRLLLSKYTHLPSPCFFNQI